MGPNQEPTYDVVIVGAGPVGLAAARILGRYGHNVLVIERWKQPYPLPRAVHFDDEIGRVFQSMGLADAVRAISEPVPDCYEWRNRADDVLVSIDWSGLGPNGWPVANFFSQPQLEQVLATAVETMDNVTVRRGTEVVGIAQDDFGATVTLHDGESIATRFVLGCDGANSTVREHLGTELTDLGFYFDWLIVDTVPLDDRDWSPQNWQLCDPARPTTIVSGGPGRRRWEFMRLPGEPAERLDTPESVWRLLQPWGRTPANTDLERHCVYTFSARWAQRWSQGRVLIAGDAAHLMPPFAGQGMCSGIRDAANLSWKLDRVLRGASELSLLDTYTDERKTHLQHAISMSVELGKVICVLDENRANERDARMIAGGANPAVVLPITAQPILGPGVIAEKPDPAGLRGTLLPQLVIEHDRLPRLLDEATGSGAVLLIHADACAHELLGAESMRQLADSETRAFSIGAGDAADLRDFDGGWTRWFADHQIKAVLARPDHYIFATVSDLDEITQMVSQYRTSLRVTAHVG
ncbi:bifunctional 3-(3-hydroxy-phenyl)propionate/3-hydroxycinnamic acid hydroxylase [Nocardia rhizosphaerihabitans]|uniref:bifunctional 3-(3-hydroxy-phenyl)propionate/3-hydroxycinnamic acid hydroxylase MhpA n=1 Tax=Nocardia rhizosphaerihabitans TaxID=1691570 RepID=UPI00366ED46D